jgi:hypothetical protein
MELQEVTLLPPMPKPAEEVLTLPVGELLRQVRAFCTNVPEKHEMVNHMRRSVGVTPEGKVVINEDGTLRVYNARDFNRLRMAECVIYYDATPIQKRMHRFLHEVKENLVVVTL